MKIARVYYTEYPGRQIGDIHDVFSPENHPGSLLSANIKEVEVGDDFDASIMKGVVSEEGNVSFEVDTAKQAAKAVLLKEQQVQSAYLQMDKDIFDRMEQVFGTRRADSASATERTLQLMKDKPELFVSEGLVVDIAATGYPAGSALDSELKISGYAVKRLEEIESYAVFRLNRIKQFRIDRNTILGG